MDNIKLAELIWNLFLEPKPELRKKYKALNVPDKILHFTPFKTEHANRAAGYYDKFSEIMKKQKKEEKGIEQVVQAFLNYRERENPDLLYYALQSFLTNFRGKLSFIIPPLLKREPELTIPSSHGTTGPEVEIAVGSAEETKMDWFREDPSLNEHHGHWHIVYSNRITRDRQGEMFFYMHQQMIARYDADRLSVGISRVKPFDNMVDQPIKVGYAPGDDVRLAELISGGRQPMAQVSQAEAEEQTTGLKNINSDIAGGYYKPSDPLGEDAETKAVNRLGSTLEANPQADQSRSYGNYHGNGHVKIGSINQGVMFYTEAAIRDVVFWEWHKGVDDLYFRLQESFVPNELAAHDPKIIIRKKVLPSGDPYSADLIICNSNTFPGPGADIGQLAFGGTNWDKDFDEGDVSYLWNNKKFSLHTTKTLNTKMNKGTIRYRSSSGAQTSYQYPFLSHDPFSYFLRIENKELKNKLLTIRIFLAPQQTADDRRSWIEMDKFNFTIPGNSKKVIFRKDTEASVIRKPAVVDPSTYNLQFDPANIPIDDRWCSCGWPYHMLLPSGNKAGMPFRLMVMITDGVFDGLAQERDCGSISFCGTRNNRYPDKRPLGYPFNRKFKGTGKTITKAIVSNNTMVGKTIFIKQQ